MKKLDSIGEILLQNRIKNVLPHISGKLLDIGCGTNELVKKYKNGIGIDVFNFGEADLIVDDSSKLPFENGSFDTITIVASLNHINNREEVLKEVNRLLKTGGQLIITMIDPITSMIWHFLRSPWDRDQKERGMKEGEVYGFTKKELYRLINKSNFKINQDIKFMLGFNRLIIAKKF